MESQKNDIQASRDEIRKKLTRHYGAKTEICSRCDISLQWLRMMLQGKANMNLDVLETCWKVYNEFEAKARVKKQRIAQLEKELGEVA